MLFVLACRLCLKNAETYTSPTTSSLSNREYFTLVKFAVGAVGDVGAVGVVDVIGTGMLSTVNFFRCLERITGVFTVSFLFILVTALIESLESNVFVVSFSFVAV